MSIEKYLTLRDDLTKKRQQLQTVIEKESETAIELQNLQIALNDQRGEHQQLFDGRYEVENRRPDR